MLRLSIFLVLVVAFRLIDAQPAIFYPFGASVGDSRAPTNDDGSTGRLPLTFQDWSFYGTNYRELWVNTNGCISFTRQISSYSPAGFPAGSNYVMVAPYWVDVDLRRGGQLWYRESTDAALLQRISDDIGQSPCASTFVARWAYVVTWWATMRFGGGGSPADFQAVLVSDGEFSFAIFNYGRVGYRDGTASSGSWPSVGFNAGDGVNSISLPGSHSSAITGLENRSNVGLPGRYAYRVDNGPVACDDDDYTPVVGDDPHMLVHPIGLDHPVCFEFDGFHGDIYELINDQQNDVVMNARVVTPEFLHSRRTFFDSVYVGHGSDFITCDVNGVSLNGVDHTWESLMDQQVGAMSIFVPDVDMFIVNVKAGIEVTIRRDFSKVANHLDIFISEAAGLSETTDGIIGEFLFKHATSEPMNADGSRATLHFPATNKSVSAHMTNKRIMDGEGHITCWEVNDNIDNMMNSSLNSYLVPVLNYHR